MKEKLIRSRLKLASVLIPVVAASSLFGCNAADEAMAPGAGAANLTGQITSESPSTGQPPVPVPTGNPPTVSVPVGETCVSNDPNKLCLAMHFVTYQDSSGTPAATKDQATTIIHTMNQLWGVCNIGFQIEKYDVADPVQSGLAYGAQSQNELDQIRKAFDVPSDELLGVTTGPWGTAVNAWTAMPGSGVYGAVIEASVVGYGGGIIYAHEFGHYLGLDHPNDSSNLMNATIYTTSTNLTSSQCQAARDTVGSSWPAMIRK